MSCHGFVVTLKNGKKICIPLYREIWKWPFGPQPDPWFEDLGRLVVIDDIVSGLKDHALRDTLARTIRGAAREIALPEDIVVGDGLFTGKMPTAA